MKGIIFNILQLFVDKEYGHLLDYKKNILFKNYSFDAIYPDYEFLAIIKKLSLHLKVKPDDFHYRFGFFFASYALKQKLFSSYKFYDLDSFLEHISDVANSILRDTSELEYWQETKYFEFNYSKYQDTYVVCIRLLKSLYVNKCFFKGIFSAVLDFFKIRGRVDITNYHEFCKSFDKLYAIYLIKIEEVQNAYKTR